MSLETKLIAIAQAIGVDVKALKLADGDLTALTTTAKTSLVAAINELAAAVGGAGAVIDDAAGDGATTVVWSADKVYDSIEAAKVAVQSSILGGASAAYDTMVELQALFEANDTTSASFATALTNRVRFDAAQTLNAAQKLQACTNIGVGDPESDLVAAYVAAKL